MSNNGKKSNKQLILGVVAVLIVGGTLVSRMNTSGQAPINVESIEQVYEEVEQTATSVALIQSDQNRAEDISDEEVRAMVREAVTLAGGLEDIVSDGDIVVLKPNLMSAIHETFTSLEEMMNGMPAEETFLSNKRLAPQLVNGVTTDYRVTKAVAEMVRELNPSGEILVMEGSIRSYTDKIMEHLGYTPENIPFVDEFIALEDRGTDYTVENGSEDFVAIDLGEKALYEDNGSLAHLGGLYFIDKRYYEADVVIDMPALKNHMVTGMTGAIKNVGIGMTPQVIYSPNNDDSLRFNINHEWTPLHKFIHDFYMVKPVDFVVTDGLQGLQHGPLGHEGESLEAVQMNKRLILAGKDAVAVDTIHSLVIGVDPLKIDFIKTLADDGMGIMDLSLINVVGNRSVSDVKEHFDFPKFWPGAVGGPTSYEDFEAPVVTLAAANLSESDLQIVFGADETVEKAEIFHGDKLVHVESIQTHSTNFSIANEGFDLANMSMVVYDRYLNGVVVELEGE